jgi:hypothetical protein
VLASGVADCEFEPHSDQTKDYKIGICWARTKKPLIIKIMCLSAVTYLPFFLVFCVVYCQPLLVFLSFFFWLWNCLSLFIVSDYSFGIFKLFFINKAVTFKHYRCNWNILNIELHKDTASTNDQTEKEQKYKK